MTISFDMNTPNGARCGGWNRGAAHKSARPAGVAEGNAFDLPRHAAQERLVRLLAGFPHRCIPQLKAGFSPAM
jgi:hypothetical protein